MSRHDEHGIPGFLGPGLAVPRGMLSGDEYESIAVGLSARTPREASLIRAAVRRSGIEQRHSVLATVDRKMPFYTEGRAPGEPLPGTAARMEVYEREAPPLALAAAREVLSSEAVPTDAITHVITVSCTGFMSPGLDFHLVRELGLRTGTRRLHLGFLGCHAALNAFGAARAICLGDPSAVVLVVMVELCTLHYQQGLGRDAILPNALFADGASAFLAVGTATPFRSQARYGMGPAQSHLIPGTAELMTWRITDHGFRMTLDSAVPDTIGAVLPDLLGVWGWDTRDPGTDWAIHPGGPRVVEQTALVLGLPEGAADESREVLRRRGNMSSATLLFVLKELLACGAETVRMLAFGPGLNVEGATLHRRG